MNKENNVNVNYNEFMHYFKLHLYCKEIIEYKNKEDYFDFMVKNAIEKIEIELNNYKK